MFSWVLLEKCLLAYSSGVLAAVSPCVIVLIPLLLVRFLKNTTGKSRWQQHKELLQFIVGFQASYLVFGYVLSAVLTSSIQNGFKLGLGALFMATSVLSASDLLDPLDMPLFKNTFAMGVSVALLMSFNPCTVPFLAVIISVNTAETLLALLCFGNGLLTPALLCVFLGRSFIKAVNRRSGGVMHKFGKLMAVILGVSSLYILHSVPVINGVSDLLVAICFLWLSVLFAGHSFMLLDVSDSVHLIWTKVCARQKLKTHNYDYEHDKPYLWRFLGVVCLLLCCSATLAHVAQPGRQDVHTQMAHTGLLVQFNSTNQTERTEERGHIVMERVEDVDGDIEGDVDDDVDAERQQRLQRLKALMNADTTDDDQADPRTRDEAIRPNIQDSQQGKAETGGRDRDEHTLKCLELPVCDVCVCATTTYMGMVVGWTAALALAFRWDMDTCCRGAILPTSSDR